MKHERKINKIINTYISQFAITAKLGTDFACWEDDRIVNYCFVVGDVADLSFMQFAKILEPNLTVDSFLLSLFHEIGHIMTYDKLTINECLYSNEEKEKIGAELDNLTSNDSRYVLAQFRYFTLPDEIKATKWALKYLKKNYNEVKEFWDKLQPEILAFYRDNNILQE